MDKKFFTIGKFLSGMCYVGAFFCFAAGCSFISFTQGRFVLTLNQMKVDSLVGVDLIFLAAALLLESVYFYFDPHKLF